MANSTLYAARAPPYAGAEGAMRDLRERVGRRIRELRRAARLTQEELAERLGADSLTVSRWERGVRAPSLKALATLAAALSVDVAELFGNPTGRGRESPELERIVETLELLTEAERRVIRRLIEDHLEGVALRVNLAAEP